MLERDPYESDPYTIHTIKVDYTFSDGRLVFSRASSMSSREAGLFLLAEHVMGHFSGNSLLHATALPISICSGCISVGQLTADFGGVFISHMVRPPQHLSY